MKLSSRRTRTVVALGYTLLLLGLSLAPGRDIARLGFMAAYDKAAHFAAYALYALIMLWTQAAWTSSTSRPHLRNLLVLVYCSGFGAVMELLQATLCADREFSVGDMLANAAGVLLVVAVSITCRAVLSHRSRVARRRKSRRAKADRYP